MTNKVKHIVKSKDSFISKEEESRSLYLPSADEICKDIARSDKNFEKSRSRIKKEIASNGKRTNGFIV